MIVRDKRNTFLLLFAWHGTILPKILPALLLIMSCAAILAALSYYHFFAIPAVPTIGFTIFGVILSIFLGFRNSACYERWWEARKLWGALIANTRHLVRDTYVLSDSRRERILYQLIVFSNLLRDRLRQQTANPTQLIAYGTHPDNIEQLNNHINAAQYTLEQIQKSLIEALKTHEISDIVYSTLHHHVVELGNIQAGCDRIASTPLPYSYSVLLHRAVYCFCFMLPFSLGEIMGLFTPILVGLLAYLFLGLDELSAQIEEPFGIQENDLPLDSIVRLVEREILTSLNVPLPPVIEAQQHNLL
jgi:putative membrane protein